MILIGEKINSTLSASRAAMEKRDAAAIAALARDQAAAGAAYLDINAGLFLEDEASLLAWLAGAAQEAAHLPLAIDSTRPEAIEAALRVPQAGKPIINSITGEKARWDTILPLVRTYKTAVVALSMDDTGMPETAEDRLTIAGRMIEGLTQAGVAIEDIYIDPLVRPIGTGSHYGRTALDTIRRVKEEYPGARTVCGLSNISYGIPARALMNRTFLVAALCAGLDAAILNVLDRALMAALRAAEALIGNDEYCMEYLEQYRAGALGD